MYLTILAPDREIFAGDVEKITFPGSAGSFQVLENHAPLISVLEKGTIFYSDVKQEQALAIEAGWVEVCDNRITVLVISASNN